MKIELSDGRAASDCVYCRETLGAEEPLRWCDACAVVVHASCAKELRRCSTLGCEGSWTSRREPIAEAPANQAPSRRRRWPWLIPGLPALALAAAWLTTLPLAPGQEAELGGWFHGHGGTLAAIAGTLGAGYRRALGSASVRCLAWSPDGERLASVDLDRELIVWDVDTGAIALEQTLPFEPVFGDPRWLGWCPDRPELLAGVGLSLQVIDPVRGEVRRLPVSDALDLALSDPELLAGWVGPEGKVLLAYVNDAPRLAVAASRQLAQPWQLAGGQSEQRYQTAAFSPDGRALVAAHEGRIDLWELEGRRVRPVPLRLGYVYGVAFRDADTFACLLDEEIVLWSLSAWRELARWSFPSEDYGYQLRFSPDGSRLASYGSQTTLFDGEGRIVRRYPNHQRLTYQVAFSPDGRRLATGGKDQVARVWRVPE